MRKKLYLVLIVLLLSHLSLSSQTVIYPDANDSTIIQIREFYEGYGKIFDIKVLNNLEFIKKCSLKNRQSFSLSKEKLIRAEYIYLSKYNLSKYNKRQVSRKYLFKRNKKMFSKYYRQYLCFLNDKGEEMVRIIFLSYNLISEPTHGLVMADWKVCPQYAHGYDPEDYTIGIVNLNTESIDYGIVVSHK